MKRKNGIEEICTHIHLDTEHSHHLKKKTIFIIKTFVTFPGEGTALHILWNFKQ